MNRLALLACVIFMGAKGCVSIPAHDYINTAAFPGIYDTFPGEVPTSFCASDPFGLDNYAHLRDRLELWLDGPVPGGVVLPEAGNPRSSATPGPFHYHSPMIPMDIPAQFFVTDIKYQDYSQQYYRWTVSGFAYDPYTCAHYGWNCPYLSVVPGATLATVTITSGWQNFTTGQSCWNVWPNRFLSCHLDGSHEPDWWECLLPLNAGLPPE